jgi:hypothetical protein
MLHVICPHPPFVFTRDGREPPLKVRFQLHDDAAWHRQNGAGADVYRDAYAEQADWIDGRVKGLVETILARSKVPPVIVIQGDHGPRRELGEPHPSRRSLQERFTILLAIHLPGGPREPLPDTLSTVNVFRVVLNAVFGTDLPLLPDRSYHQLPRAPYLFEEVTQHISDVPPPSTGTSSAPAVSPPTPPR